jgi:hypothetical protein
MRINIQCGNITASSVPFLLSFGSLFSFSVFISSMDGGKGEQQIYRGPSPSRCAKRVGRENVPRIIWQVLNCY